MIPESIPSDPDQASENWSFEDGVLSIHHLGKTISLGRYATLAHASRAAEKYLAQHGPDNEARNPA